jgi:hypothetical protein
MRTGRLVIAVDPHARIQCSESVSLVSKAQAGTVGNHGRLQCELIILRKPRDLSLPGKKRADTGGKLEDDPRRESTVVIRRVVRPPFVTIRRVDVPK